MQRAFLREAACPAPSRAEQPKPSPPGRDAIRRSGFFLISYQSASYLKDRATRVRNAVTFPLSTFISILVTSATRRSRSELAAVSTALRPASSQDSSLTPTTSIMRRFLTASSLPSDLPPVNHELCVLTEQIRLHGASRARSLSTNVSTEHRHVPCEW
jgi:hypothetical protein